ncbi:uncharacterized protein A4U43_C08F26810 [Asparagus officinalis]|nr:uncharacterized protein A4U43_C08F26810 [Asparagus officinalis]
MPTWSVEDDNDPLAGNQGRLTVLLVSMKESAPRRQPAIVFLHSSYKCKEWLHPLLEAYASRGYIAVAIDSRYHGERASNRTTYLDEVEMLKLEIGHLNNRITELHESTKNADLVEYERMKDEQQQIKYFLH